MLYANGALRIYLPMSPIDRRATELALGLLARFAPNDHRRVVEKLEAIAFDPHVCPPGSIACLNLQRGRIAFLVGRPSNSDPVELAVSIQHEAAHIGITPDGAVYPIPHSCSEPACLDPLERARDPIYRHDDEVRVQILGGLAAEQFRVRAAGQYWVRGAARW